MSLGKILKITAIPLVILLSFISLELLSKFFGLPPRDEVLRIVTEFVNEYGITVIFLSAVVEGLLLAGNYFPGGAVIFIGVMSAVGNIPRAMFVVVVVCIAFTVSYTADYFIGKYGWYKLLIKFGLGGSVESMKEKVLKHLFTAVLSSYWLPNMASICSTTAGIMQIPFRKFILYSTIGVVFWNAFWGIFVYITGDALLRLDLIYILAILLAWCAVIVAKVYFMDKYLIKSEIIADKDF
ncbi:MAG: VTT domain-containing protein [Patescibacteria group bacterium]